MPARGPFSRIPTMGHWLTRAPWELGDDPRKPMDERRSAPGSPVGAMGNQRHPVETYEHRESQGYCAAFCGTRLSRYNPQTMCAPCSRSMTLAGGSVPDAIATKNPPTLSFSQSAPL